MNKMICFECHGQGKTLYTCCGDDIMGTKYEDHRICPSCFEHVGEPEECESCDGLGIIYINED